MHSRIPDAESRRSTDAGPVTQLVYPITGRAYSLPRRQTEAYGNRDEVGGSRIDNVVGMSDESWCGIVAMPLVRKGACTVKSRLTLLSPSRSIRESGSGSMIAMRS
jgi:hypothetical protein